MRTKSTLKAQPANAEIISTAIILSLDYSYNLRARVPVEILYGMSILKSGNANAVEYILEVGMYWLQHPNVL
jgi:hypothetical protein